MTHNMSGLILELEEDLRLSRQMEKLCMTYHSRTRLATSKSGVEAFVPCSDTATSNINFSSSRGRYGPREFLQDIKIIGRSRIS